MMATIESIRLKPPFWRHDAYTLRRLATAVSTAAKRLLLSSKSKSTVVDLGAGATPYRPIFEQLGASYVACDIDATGDTDIVPMKSGQRMNLPDELADIVVSFQVLEHVWDLDWYLGEAHRLLSPNGKLLISTHGTWPYHPHPTDFRRWTRDGLIAELESRGFKTEAITPLVGPLAWTTQFRALGYHHLLSKIPLIGNIASVIFCTAMYLRMTIEDKMTPNTWTLSNAAIYVITAKKEHF